MSRRTRSVLVALVTVVGLTLVATPAAAFTDGGADAGEGLATTDSITTYSSTMFDPGTEDEPFKRGGAGGDDPSDNTGSGLFGGGTGDSGGSGGAPSCKTAPHRLAGTCL
jgi:hypothetical protein